jgi:hypothetical protein
MVAHVALNKAAVDSPCKTSTVVLSLMNRDSAIGLDLFLTRTSLQKRGSGRNRSGFCRVPSFFANNSSAEIDEIGQKSRVSERFVGAGRMSTLALKGLLRRVAIGFAFWLFLALLPSYVRASQPSVRKNQSRTHSLYEAISVEPGATCIQKAALIRYVAKWLERPEIDRRIRVKVEGSGESTEKATFTIYKGDRFPNRSNFESTANSCDEFRSALGLSIAMAINATWIEPLPKESPFDSLTNQRLLFSIHLLGSYSVLPGFAPGIQAHFESWYDWFALRAGIMAFFAFNESIGDKIEGKFDANSISGDLALCVGGTPVHIMRFAFCTGIAGGPYRTEGSMGGRTNLIMTESRTSPWAAIVAAGEIAVPLSDWMELAITADLLIALWDRTIQIADTDKNPIVQYDISRFGLSVGIGPVFSIQ